MNNYPYLKDLDFLNNLVLQPIQSIYIKFTSLDWNETPLCEIQGLATGGTLNLNGQSAIRRTCNLSLIIPDKVDYQISDKYSIKQLIGVDNKIRLQLGVLNTTEKYTNYDILWFPLGLFVITQSSFSHSLSGLNVSLQLQDKMSLLNGTCGGVLPAEVNFSKVDELSVDGTYGTKDLTLYQIIQEAVNHWGGEPLEKIVISDIPDKIQKLVVWNPEIDKVTKAKPSLFLYFSNIWQDGDSEFEPDETAPGGFKQKYTSQNNNANLCCITIGDKIDGKYVLLKQDYAKLKLAASGVIITTDEYIPTTSEEKRIICDNCHTVEISSFSPAGAQYVDFTYSDDLVVRAGGNLCEVLDKIKNYLGNFEYFYQDDVFYFREKRNYLNTTKTTIDIKRYKELQKQIAERSGSDPTAETSTETFYDPSLMSEMPINILELGSTNYFLQNGNSKGLAIFNDDRIITSYSNSPQYSKIKNDFIVWGTRKTLEGKASRIRYHLVFDQKPKIGNTYEVAFMFSEVGIVEGEIQYDRLAKMPYKYSSFSNFPKTGIEGLLYFDKSTGKYYIWDAGLEIPVYVEEKVQLKSITTKDWRDELFLSGMKAEVEGLVPNSYYAELKEEWPKIYDTENQHFREEFLLNPGNYNYFLDFIDTDSYAFDISVSKIGRRLKVEDSDKINCLFEPIYPKFVYINQLEYNDLDIDERDKLIKDLEQQGLTYLIVPEEVYNQLTSASTSTNSAFFEARDLMMQYSGFNENISLQCLPMYFIEPNTRITVDDKASEISGDYEINSISLPLTAGGTMSISASKIIDRL